jgi:hypothetical protein
MDEHRSKRIKLDLTYVVDLYFRKQVEINHVDNAIVDCTQTELDMALRRAVYQKDLALVKLLLSAGADPNHGLTDKCEEKREKCCVRHPTGSSHSSTAASGTFYMSNTTTERISKCLNNCLHQSIIGGDSEIFEELLLANAQIKSHCELSPSELIVNYGTCEIVDACWKHCKTHVKCELLYQTISERKYYEHRVFADDFWEAYLGSSTVDKEKLVDKVFGHKSLTEQIMDKVIHILDDVGEITRYKIIGKLISHNIITNNIVQHFLFGLHGRTTSDRFNVYSGSMFDFWQHPPIERQYVHGLMKLGLKPDIDKIIFGKHFETLSHTIINYPHHVKEKDIRSWKHVIKGLLQIPDDSENCFANAMSSLITNKACRVRHGAICDAIWESGWDCVQLVIEKMRKRRAYNALNKILCSLATRCKNSVSHDYGTVYCIDTMKPSIVLDLFYGDYTHTRLDDKDKRKWITLLCHVHKINLKSNRSDFQRALSFVIDIIESPVPVCYKMVNDTDPERIPYVKQRIVRVDDRTHTTHNTNPLPADRTNSTNTHLMEKYRLNPLPTSCIFMPKMFFVLPFEQRETIHTLLTLRTVNDCIVTYLPIEIWYHIFWLLTPKIPMLFYHENGDDSFIDCEYPF